MQPRTMPKWHQAGTQDNITNDNIVQYMADMQYDRAHNTYGGITVQRRL